MYLKELEIGNVKLKNNIILAPMAGVTDLPFRSICKKFNPGMVCTEMVSSKALFYNDNKTKKLLDTTGEKGLVSYQIFGSDVETMGFAANYLNEFADIIDINMGCPAPKVVKNGDGSKLMQDLEKAKKIIQTVVTRAKVPVTVKMRAGWDKQNITAVELAKIAQNSGASGITIHGRTRSEFYSGNADLEIIKKVKEAVNIPVIGNGDIVDGKLALKMFEQTGVDGIMIGRGAFGNPWIFKEIQYFLETGKKINEPTNIEKLEIIKEHIELAVKQKGEVAVKELRKYIAWYTKKLKNSSEFRNDINKIETKEELLRSVNRYFTNL